MRCKNQAKAALIISHPGHELRVHHWVEKTRPLVLVLTDGSGPTHSSRLASTSAVLQKTCARPGAIYGRFSDLEVYSHIIARNISLFCELLEDMVLILEKEEIDLVAGDALEYYNPSHDLCRYLIGAAIEIAQRRTKRPILNFDFPLRGRPDVCPLELRDRALWISLDDSGLERKVTASREYPELAQEVEAALRTLGVGAFRNECLRPVTNNAGVASPPEEQPFYEQHGQKRVQEGVYRQVIRYCDHMQPIAEALWRHTSEES